MTDGNKCDTKKTFCQVNLVRPAGIISSDMFGVPVDKFYVNLYSGVRFRYLGFSEGVKSMYTLSRLTRRGYYQRVLFLSEIILMQDCLRRKSAI